MLERPNNTGWEIIQAAKIIDEENCDELRSCLLNLLNNKQLNVRFDFSDAKKINTAALNIFTVFSDLLKNEVSDYNLEIINANDDIVNLFRMTHLDHTYKINTGKIN